MTASSSPAPTPKRVQRIQAGDLAKNTLSIVVFGPGHGESICVFLPDGNVGVVDGCREPTRGDRDFRGDPVRELLVDYEKVKPNFLIRFVCLTHPHGDHYAGLGRLMAEYDARIERAWEALPAAGRYPKTLLEYQDSKAARRGVVPDDGPSLTGLSRVFDAFKQFRKGRPIGCVHLQHNQILYEADMGGERVTIRGWAPQSADAGRALEDLVRAVGELATDGEPREHDPNLISGALSITWGKAGVLLAGDALREKGSHLGWKGAHELAKQHSIQIVNVAHHASEAAHDEELWAYLKPRIAIVTPFREAEGDMPPRPEQIANLISPTCTVAITAPPAWPKNKKNPQPLSGRHSKKPLGKIAMQPAAADPSRYAVGVSLDRTGRIVRFVLAAGADVYRFG